MGLCKVFGSIKLFQQHTGTAKETPELPAACPTLVVSVHGEHSQPQPTQFQLKQQLACTKPKKGVGKRGNKEKI